MIASRADDGRFDAPVRLHEDRRPSGSGRLHPFPAGWRLPWLGFVDPVVDVAPVALDGPDPVSSAAYATDYEEARMVGLDDRVDEDPRADGDRRVLRGQLDRLVPQRVV